MGTRAVGIICGLMVSVACALPPTSPGRPPIEEEYRVAPPDVLAIKVLPEGVVRNVTVRPDGRISWDLIGDVQVEGRTVLEIRDQMTARLRQFIVSPTVTVELANSNSRRFYVFGQVRRPGAYPLLGRVRATEALASAGGGTLFANLNAARLTRVGEEGGAFGVRYKDILERADGATNHELMPDDVIWVPPSLTARIGFAIQRALFPLTAIFGVGRDVGGTAAAF